MVNGKRAAKQICCVLFTIGGKTVFLISPPRHGVKKLWLPVFMSTKVLLFLIPMLHSPVNAHRRQFEQFLLKLSSFVSVSDIILRYLSEFHVNHVNDCLYCISCMVCYNVEELRSRCDAKLQLEYFYKNIKIRIENKRFGRNVGGRIPSCPRHVRHNAVAMAMAVALATASW